MVPRYDTPGFERGAVRRIMYPIIAKEVEARMKGARFFVRSERIATMTVRIVATA